MVTTLFRCAATVCLVLGVTILPAGLAHGQLFDVHLSSAFGETGDTVEIVATLDHYATGIVPGWSVGVCHNPALLEVIDVADGSIFDLYPPDFFHLIQTYSNGWTVGLVYEIGSNGIPPGVGYEMYRVTYEIVGTATDVVADLTFCNTLGSPPVQNVIVWQGVGIPPNQFPGSVAINPMETFRRGDANDDGTVNIADPVAILEELFYSGREISCVDAADGNDDGNRDIADVVFILDALFGGASVLPPPGPFDCGEDPTDDSLLCANEQCP